MAKSLSSGEEIIALKLQVSVLTKTISEISKKNPSINFPSQTEIQKYKEESKVELEKEFEGSSEALINIIKSL